MGLFTVLKSSQLSLSSSHRNEVGGRRWGESYELFTRKVTLRGHGKEPAVSPLHPPPQLVFLVSSSLYLSSTISLNAETDYSILYYLSNVAVIKNQFQFTSVISPFSLLTALGPPTLTFFHFVM